MFGTNLLLMIMSEVKEVHSIKEAAELLPHGWAIISAAEESDGNWFCVLGRTDAAHIERYAATSKARIQAAYHSDIAREHKDSKGIYLRAERQKRLSDPNEDPPKKDSCSPSLCQ